MFAVPSVSLLATALRVGCVGGGCASNGNDHVLLIGLLA
jgi:hypothetical protein